jgi:hypothetical protein
VERHSITNEKLIVLSAAFCYPLTIILLAKSKSRSYIELILIALVFLSWLVAGGGVKDNFLPIFLYSNFSLCILLLLENIYIIPAFKQDRVWPSILFRLFGYFALLGISIAQIVNLLMGSNRWCMSLDKCVSVSESNLILFKISLILWCFVLVKSLVLNYQKANRK